jgi:hypothetical protein
VGHLSDQNQLDLGVLHGDGTNTVAKKGGDGIGYSGYKHQKGEKVIAMTDNNGYVLSPLPVAPANEADIILLPDGLRAVISKNLNNDTFPESNAGSTVALREYLRVGTL